MFVKYITIVGHYSSGILAAMLKHQEAVIELWKDFVFSIGKA
jgi:hypothetical protein